MKKFAIFFMLLCASSIYAQTNNSKKEWWDGLFDKPTNVNKKATPKKKTTPKVSEEKFTDSQIQEPDIPQKGSPKDTQQKPNTPSILYYDYEWKGVSDAAFATFFRILSNDDDYNYKQKCRDFYITGELQGESEYVSIDKYDDTKSIFTGPFVTYYKSGQIESKGYRSNGVLQGEYEAFYENGLLMKHVNFVDGKFQGIYTEFSAEGDRCMQIEYERGQPKYNYYYLSNKDGYILKLSLSDNTPIWESPDESEKQTRYKDGAEWPYYVKNGLVVAMTNEIVSDYGKYYRVSMIIANNSLVPIDIDPLDIETILTDKKGRNFSLRVLSSDEYARRIENRQNWNKFFVGLAEGIAAAGAGYSTSTTNSYASYSGYGNSNFNAYAIGSGGYAYGHGSSSTYWSGSSSATSTTTTYNGAAAYQAQIIASERIAAYNSALDEEREIRQAGYFKKTTIYPGETVSGYVNIEQKKGVSLYVNVHINDAVYKFPWNIP